MKEYKGEIVFIGIAIMLYLVFAAFNVSANFSYLGFVFGIFGLCMAWKVYEHVDDQSAGNAKMVEIANSIHEGAMVFLSREYKILGYFIAIVFLVLFILISKGSGKPTQTSPDFRRTI